MAETINITLVDHRVQKIEYTKDQSPVQIRGKSTLRYGLDDGYARIQKMLAKGGYCIYIQGAGRTKRITICSPATPMTSEELTKELKSV